MPMLLSVVGRLTISMRSQPAKALVPMLVTPSGMTTRVRYAQPLNAAAPIARTGYPSIAEGMTSSPLAPSQPVIVTLPSAIVYCRSAGSAASAPVGSSDSAISAASSRQNHLFFMQTPPFQTVFADYKNYYSINPRAGQESALFFCAPRRLTKQKSTTPKSRAFLFDGHIR